MARLSSVKVATACAVFAVLAVAGCSASPSLSASALNASASSRSSGAPASSASAAAAGASPSAAPAQSPNATATATATGAATAADSFSAPPSVGTSVGNITIAQTAGMAAGPMTITPVYCGALSSAQQAQFGTTAAGGLIYRYANHSGEPAAAKLYVAFTDGSTVAGENYAGTLPEIASGKSAEAEVDAIGITGQGVTFTGCELESYALAATSGVDPVSYAGLRSLHARNARGAQPAAAADRLRRRGRSRAA
jgi:hypothetical protein